jgi:hypothetical protein
MAAPYADIKYGFRTTVKESTSTTLGHQPLTALVPVQGLIFKANSPKPRRASRRTATGLESSFVGAAAITAAIAAGFDIVKARPNGRKTKTRFQVPVYVTINGVKYAWGLRKAQFTKLGTNLKTLGITEVTGTETDLVFGASFPKPPRATSVATQGEETVTTSSFYDPSKEAAVQGLFSTYAGQYTASDWSNFV